MRYKKAIKIILIVLCAIFAFIPINAFSSEDDFVDITPLLNEALDKVDFSAFQEFITDNEYFGAYSAATTPKEFITNLINGKNTLSFENLINAIFDNFISSLKTHANYSVIIAAIALISVLSEKLSNGLFNGKISSYTSKILFAASLAVITKSFALCLRDCMGGIQKMTDFINSTFPIFTVLITSIGNACASQILQPTLTLAASAVSNIICNVIMPLLTMSAVMSMCHCISEKKPFFDSYENTKKAADKIVGIVFTVFFGFVSVQKLTSSALDTVSLRTIRYTLSSFSVYGGAFLSKSFDIVTGCAVMLKNIIGGLCMIILLTLCLFPAVKLLCASVVYGTVSFLISLTGETRISSCMTCIGKIYGTMFLCTITIAMLLFIIISVISSVGNSVIGA